MNSEEIKDKLNQSLVLDNCIVTGEGGTFKVVAVGDIFKDLSRVKKQQVIYQQLNDEILSNAIHALTIKALTPDEWQKQKHFI